MAGLGLRPVSDTSDRPGQADWSVLDAIEALDRLSPASLKPGGLGWGWLRRVAGWAGPEASLSHEAAKPWAVLGSWIMVLVAPGTSAGWAELCLGGSLDGLRLGSESQTRKTRQQAG